MTTPRDPSAPRDRTARAVPRALRRRLTAGPRYSAPRVLLDLALWLALAAAAEAIGHPAAIGLAALLIGAVPAHDVLVHGHEATHGLAARGRRANALLLWFTHALLGLSGRAYRALHLDHHAATHEPDDPEIRFYAPRTGQPRGWDYLRVPLLSHWVVNTWPWRAGRTRVRPGEVAVDLAGAALLHAVIVLAVGPRAWALYLALPVFTGLAGATILRALTEHHGAERGDPLRSTRATAAHPLLQLLWSNVDHHLEHHLAPGVPWHRLPALRRHLASHYAEQGITFDRGLVPTALGLLLDPDHVTGDAFVSRRDPGYRLKVRWFRDILRHRPARQHLWSLYFHGEAYEQLHPLGVWIDKLDPRWGRKLRRQLDDENRHAGLFRALLDDEGLEPRPVEGPEDVGWYLLHQVIPDVCEAAGRPGRFTRRETMRYLGFLHALETRSVGDLCALREAARAEGLDHAAGVVDTILADERWHASWTWVALCTLARDPAEAEAIYAPIRAGERAASHRVVLRLLEVFTELGAAPAGAGDLRWRLMGLAARLGLAVPPLPRFDLRGRVPDTLVRLPAAA